MYKILIADDEVIECRVLKKKLERMFPDSVEVLTAGNGRETIARYEEQRPQILILDIEMPGISGLDAAEEIRRKDRTCSIIFLTAFDEFDYARKAITVRALDYLLKPCDEKELQTVVQEAMRIADQHAAEQSPVLTSLNRENQSAGKPEDQTAAEKDSSSGAASDNPDREQPDGSLAEAAAAAGTAGEPEKPAAATPEQEMRLFIEQHYGEPLSVQDAAAHFGYADAYFCRIFKQHFGTSFITYLTNYRIQKAKELLGQREANVKDVAKAVGYEDSNYFAKVFRRTTGVSPTEYRAGQA